MRESHHLRLHWRTDTHSANWCLWRETHSYSVEHMKYVDVSKYEEVQNHGEETEAHWQKKRKYDDSTWIVCVHQAISGIIKERNVALHINIFIAYLILGCNPHIAIGFQTLACELWADKID